MNDLGLGIIVSLKDAFTQNAARIQSSMQTLDASVEAGSENMTRNLGLIEKGTMMIGAGMALLAIPTTLVASTAATQKALGELASVGVKDFRAMEDAAESFTNEWAGSSKAEFITAAYDVKSALANLSDTAVGTFAAMAALTAKATKATTQEMVETFTTAYGIFRPIMKDMSDMDWAKTFSGALAETVGVFKTTGPQMAEAIKNIGAIAAASNVSLQEQMAILGQLQTTMPGSEAGTLYKAFMLKAAEAGQDLKLSFIDAKGQLKGIVPILQELKRKFPDLSQAAVQVKLKKAFGSDEAVRFLLQMSMGLDQLEGNIKSIEQAMKDGTSVTLEMAKAMNMDIGSQFEKVKQQLQNLFEILGRMILPVVVPLFGGVSKIILSLQGMARSTPGLTRLLLTLCAAFGAILVVVGNVVATLGTVRILLPAIEAGVTALGGVLSGVGAAVSTYLLPVIAVIAALILTVVLLKKVWETNFGGIRDAVLGAWNKISIAFQGIRTLITSLRSGTGEMSAELAQKLQAAGLMKFVITVFRIYYRIREFIVGLNQAFQKSFGPIRAILEPTVRGVIKAYSDLFKAVSSVYALFGKSATTLDAKSYRNLGTVLGKVFGILLQIAGYVLKYWIFQITLIVKGMTLFVRIILWVAQALQTAAGSAERFWRAITEKARLGGYLLCIPFFYLENTAASVWTRITMGVSSGWTMIGNAVRRGLSSILSAISGLVSSVFQSGRSIMTTLANGIRSAVMAPYEAARSALLRLRRLLPFSDAREGPLSTLTQSGSAMLEAFSRGISNASGLPAKVLERSFESMQGNMRKNLFSGVMAGTLALTPIPTGAIPQTPISSDAKAPQRIATGNTPEQVQLLSRTHGVTETPGSTLQDRPEEVRRLLSAILAKLDGLSDRPIDVQVIAKLDGRQIAQAVYKDMRERKVRNYETL